jgi:AAA15 family ATPase/GTPase
MIHRINLSDIASFKNRTFLDTDKKINLIYGLNGTGKSTISNLLYRPAEPKFNKCHIEGLNDAELLVYNQTFIQENFFESENLRGIFTLSKVNKEAEEKIISAAKEIKRLEVEQAKKSQELEKIHEQMATKITAAKTKV